MNVWLNQKLICSDSTTVLLLPWPAI